MQAALDCADLQQKQFIKARDAFLANPAQRDALLKTLANYRVAVAQANALYKLLFFTYGADERLAHHEAFLSLAVICSNE